MQTSHYLGTVGLTFAGLTMTACPEPTQVDAEQADHCEGVPLANGTLSLPRTTGSPNSATLSLPPVDTLCLEIHTNSSSARVSVDDVPLWSPSESKNVEVTKTKVVSNLGSEEHYLDAEIAGQPGDFLNIDAFVKFDAQALSSGPSSPDESIVIGQAFIAYHYARAPEMFAGWDDVHVGEVQTLYSLEGEIAAFELEVVDNASESAGYLVLEKDPLRPLLGLASVEGQTISTRLRDLFEESSGKQLDGLEHRFLWSGMGLMALDVILDDDVTRVETCPSCGVSYSTDGRPAVNFGELGLTPEQWIERRKTHVAELLSQPQPDRAPTPEYAVLSRETHGSTATGHRFRPRSQETLGDDFSCSAAEENEIQTNCQDAYAGSVPGGKAAFRHFWQLHDVEGEDECRWEEIGLDESDPVCGWTGCGPVAMLGVMDYWDKRYGYLLDGLDSYPTEDPTSEDMNGDAVIDALNEMRIRLGTFQWPKTGEGATLFAHVPLGIETYVKNRITPPDDLILDDSGWRSSNEWATIDGDNERLSLIRSEIDAGHPPIIQYHPEKEEGEDEAVLQWADHMVVGVSYFDDGRNDIDADLMGVVWGWSEHFFREVQIVPTEGVALFIVTSVKPNCSADDGVHLCASYNDVPPGHWASKSIETLSCECVVRGYPDGSFGLDSEVTKAEFLKILARVAYDEDYDGQRVSTPGRGVCATEWSSGYVDFAESNEMLLDPILDDNCWFQPNETISRQEAAYLIVQAGKKSSEGDFDLMYDAFESCFEGVEDLDDPYNDVGEDKIDAEYLPYVLAATSQCVFEGYEAEPGNDENDDQLFYANRKLTRGEAAKIACVARYGLESTKPGGLCDLQEGHTCAPVIGCP